MKFSIALLVASLVPASALTREPFSRRDAISAAAAGLAGGLLTQVQPSFAAGTPPTKEELDRIVLGYKQITALLNDFEASTTVCRENGGECKRDAEPIRESCRKHIDDVHIEKDSHNSNTKYSLFLFICLFSKKFSSRSCPWIAFDYRSFVSDREGLQQSKIYGRW